MTSSEVYLLPLNDDGSPQVEGHQYIYLTAESDNPVVVRFAIEGTSSICNYGSLWVNIPEKGAAFQRNHFREFKLVADFHRTIHISIPIYDAGAFCFYITYSALPDLTAELDSSEMLADEEKKKTPVHYIDVAPRLKLEGRRLPLEALSVFSIISKFMGKYPDDWERHLRGISDRGYNMVHFAPLQVRGESKSPYSLYDQLAWDPDCFPRGEQDVQAMVESLKNNHSLLGLSDIVLNHTANNSAWLLDHPEAGYNLKTAPHLESAYLLDSKLLELSDKLASLGLPTELKTTDDLIKIMEAIKSECINGMRLWEYYTISVDRDAGDAIKFWASGQVSLPAAFKSIADLSFLKTADVKVQVDFLTKYGLVGNDGLGTRYRRRIEAGVAAALLTAVYGTYGVDRAADEAAITATAHGRMVSVLDVINVSFYAEYDKDVAEILQELFNRIKYCRLDGNGPKLGPINKEAPLIETYFTRLPRNYQTARFDIEELVLVNNGWVWGGNALVDNAGPSSRVYLLRQVIVWGDCVKLRYGSGPSDNPWLWGHMTSYARMLAKYFSGFRIDNAHSTPIHVAEHILDEARRINPDLYVVAELFTGSEDTDYIFVKRLGINSLIREAMQAWSTGEMSRLVHRHGGRPIGSFGVDDSTSQDIVKGGGDHSTASNNMSNNNNSTRGWEYTREIVHRIRPLPVQALFMDCTHDNEVPAQKRDARDTLPNAALVSMCASATGSVMGYDEIYPCLVDLVNEKRLYTSESSLRPVKLGASRNGIAGVKKLLNQIHVLMGKDGYAETHVHHEDQYVTVHRVHPESRKGYFLIAHTAYPGYGNGNGAFSPVRLTGSRARHLGSWTLEVDASAEATRAVLSDKQFLRGLPSRVIDLSGIRMDSSGPDTIITVRDKFPPGSIALFETWIPTAEHSSGLDTFVTSGAKSAFGSLDLVDLNFVLYRCEAEERDASNGQDGAYTIPGHGPLVYAGLQGWYSILKDIVRDNNLAHPLCQNLRDGQWALDYIVGRLERIAQKTGCVRIEMPAAWFKERFDAVRTVPTFLLPRYFGLIMGTAYRASCDRAMELLDKHVREGQWFLQHLALVNVQQTGIVKSASLYPDRLVPSLAAGLPHFAVSWARCWGRDVFISLRGLFLATGRFSEAREHILAFASVLKHGMIPNLLGSGNNPRYNARDATWFFLQCVQDYTRIAPNGEEVLKDTVTRRFLPYDDTYFDVSDKRAFSRTSTIEEVVQEVLQRHASGLSFREANAGPGLDMQMRDEGFNIEVHVDWETGFIFGGNQFNCGTWMDKMGESERAGSKGIPGTPRDGSAVEIVGLLYSTLTWLADRHAAGFYAYDSVQRADGTSITFQEWAFLIRHNFERCYYIPLDPADDTDHDVNTAIVNRRGIYKDLYRSGKEYEDYQLRPNFTISMTVAPDLFEPAHAMHALCLADKVLRGPMGMATLDPADLNYRPYYVNSEDSTNFATSKGRNYHQGPEWLWPTGFFLRALLKFDMQRRDPSDVRGRTEAFQQVTRRLIGCKQQIQESPWAGLAELTQKNGEFCPDSSPTQAWSAACLIDVYMDAAEEQQKRAVAKLPIRQ